MLTLGQAAKVTGLGKTTLARAIKGGRLSATRRDDGSYAIDPAELARVYTVHPETPETVPSPGDAVRHATHPETPRDPDVTARLAALETEVQGLKSLLSEVRQSRDEWRDQAARLALLAPAAAANQAIVTPPPERRRWWQLGRA